MSAGFSVQQVIDVVKAAVAEDGKTLIVEEGDRCAGDPAVLVADASKAKTTLGWKPESVDLETIVRHAWAWEKKPLYLSSGVNS